MNPDLIGIWPFGNPVSRTHAICSRDFYVAPVRDPVLQGCGYNGLRRTLKVLDGTGLVGIG